LLRSPLARRFSEYSDQWDLREALLSEAFAWAEPAVRRLWQDDQPVADKKRLKKMQERLDEEAYEREHPEEE
jgi:hypothetical protein